MTVFVEIWIQAITSVDELTNDFDMDIYITERWLDPALNFENLSPCKGGRVFFRFCMLESEHRFFYGERGYMK
ncbi:unnamed protein product [Cylicostephanus goldi]|uniref:Neurotransmitter-gated ion-channel ligand-binding domain-containing protein n=1 Tax=Cylicostephanus goldi TaxID=71465 RepID=A0A3P6QQY7_CYLGO|nr:unnamed protein product [Cylicostephanus goldi]